MMDQMMMFEYKVVPAPTRGLKAKGVKGAQARFANALQAEMNTLAADGWQYQRTDTLPMEERQGLTGRTTSYQTVLVFRRPIALVDADAPAPVAALIEDQTKQPHSDEHQDNSDEVSPKAIDETEDDRLAEAVSTADDSDDTATHSGHTDSESTNTTPAETSPRLPWAKSRRPAALMEKPATPDKNSQSIDIDNA